MNTPPACSVTTLEAAEGALISPAIVLDLETGGEASAARIRECLSGLWRELNDCARCFGLTTPELIVPYDPADLSECDLADLINSTQGGREVSATVRLMPASPGLNYYQQKNFGFLQSTRDIVIFVDSDLRLERGWLRALLEPFADPAILAVVGRTHFETTNFYERAMALFWIFDTREDASVVRPTDRLVSNNIAFRRKLFAAMPFPDRPTYRGQCSELGWRLAQFGVRLLEATGARAIHPPPQGIAAFLSRAWHAGSDAHYYDGLKGMRRKPLELLHQDLFALCKRIGERSASISAGRVALIAARMLGSVYYLTKCISYSLCAPEGRGQNLKL